MPHFRTALAVPMAALVLTSCSATDGTTPVQASVGGAKSTPESHAAGIKPLGDANLEMKTMRPPEPSKLLVTDVRVGQHDGFERIVFEFTGEGTPGWFIDYTDKPAQLGSGNAIEHKGETALNVNIDGTVHPFELDRVDPHLGTTEGTGDIVSEIISTGTFEGRSQFIVGLDDAHPYSVQVLRGPTRLVIDVLETNTH